MGKSNTKVTPTGLTRNTGNAKNGTGTISLSNGSSVSFTTVGGKTSYESGGKTYSSLSGAISGTGGVSTPSKGGTYKYNSNTGYYERTDGGKDIYGQTVVGGGTVSNLKNYSSNSINPSSNPNDISSMQFGQGTSNDYQKSRNETLGKYYSGLGKYDYNTIYNDLLKNSGFASSSEADKKNTVNRIMEQAANASGGTLNTKSDEEIAAETQKNDDEEINYDDLIGDVMGGEGEGTYGEDADEEYNLGEEESPEIAELRRQNQELLDRLDSIESLYSNRENKQSNVIKETVPEEKDNTYNYNTYWNENLADQTPYEGGQSKDIQQEGLTWSSKYEEPVTNALQDLGLLTPNEQAAESMPNTSAPEGQPETFNSAEDIINSFNEAVGTGLDEGQIASPKDAVSLYQEYKRKLEKFVNDNKLSKEEYMNFLNQMKSNEGIQNFLRNNSNQ